jgi:hypothetical protein
MDAATSGMVAACVKEVISTPANIISVRMQVADLASSAGPSSAGGASAINTSGFYSGRPSMGAVAMDLVRTDGFFGGLYRGFGLQLLTSLPTRALFWSSHRALSDALTQCWLELPLYIGPSSVVRSRSRVDSTDPEIGQAASPAVPALAISGISAFLGATFAIACTPRRLMSSRRISR